MLPADAVRTLFLVVSLLGLAARADTPVEIWKAKCKTCHGEDGSADTKIGRKEKIRDMRHPAWQADFSDEQIREVITDGSRDNFKMKPFKDKLSTEEIDSLVKHVRGFRSNLPVFQIRSEPTPTPSAPPQRTPPVPVVFGADRSPTAAARPEAPPDPRVRPTVTTPLAKPDAVAPSPVDAGGESPPVKVTVKVSEPQDAEQPPQPSSLPNSWLSMAAIALSVVALIVALTRKR